MAQSLVGIVEGHGPAPNVWGSEIGDTKLGSQAQGGKQG